MVFKIDFIIQFSFSLMPVVSEEVLHNCIECESEPSVICGCLELLKSLVRNNITGLCTKASGNFYFYYIHCSPFIVLWG